jgi:EmrB/QacA subfamily drug resistance transporter
MRLQGAISGGDVDRKVRVTESADTTLVRGSRRYILLAATSIGALLAPLNSTMIAIALPEIRGDFDVDHASLGWLISSYLIVMAVAQPLGGRLGDQIGRKRVIRWALVAFLGFSLASVVAPSFWVLVLFRTGQAIAGAAIMPNGMAMLRTSLPVSQFSRFNGLHSGVMSTAAAGGPLLGAAVLAAAPWQALFLVNIPVVALALVLIETLDYDQQPEGSASIDYSGVVLLSAALVAVTVLLNSLRGGREAVIALIATLALGIAFVETQRRAAQPGVAWHLFRLRTFSAATVNVAVMNLVMYTTLLSVPFFIEELQGGDSSRTGLLLGSMFVMMALTSPVSGALADRFGRRAPVFGGSGITLLGASLLVFGLDIDASFGFLAVALALVGLGVGSSFGPATAAAIESASVTEAGAAAGTNSMARYLGSIVGAGALAGLLNTEAGAVPEIGSFHTVMLLIVAMAAAGLVAATMVHRFPSVEVRSSS